MNIEELRAEFESWLYLDQTKYDPERMSKQEIEIAKQAYQAGRAALQSQDREDAARFRFCLEHGFPQKWEEMIRGSLRYYWTSRPGSQEEFSSAVEAIDHARRVEENK